MKGVLIPARGVLRTLPGLLSATFTCLSKSTFKVLQQVGSVPTEYVIRIPDPFLAVQ